MLKAQFSVTSRRAVTAELFPPRRLQLSIPIKKSNDRKNSKRAETTGRGVWTLLTLICYCVLLFWAVCTKLRNSGLHKTQKFVGEWLESNSLSKMKVSLESSNECAYGAYSNTFCCKSNYETFLQLSLIIRQLKQTVYEKGKKAFNIQR